MRLDRKLHRKYNLLKTNIKSLESVIVAFSGGVDSSFLLHTASSVLGKNVLAVTANSPTYTKDELSYARLFARKLGIKHIIIKTEEFNNPEFIKNPKNRCYFCKKELFSKLKGIAEKEGYKTVVDGQNFDDKNDYRPGSVASEEANINSPLKESALSKVDIRLISKKLGLSTWDRPAQACLSSRFPYGDEINKKDLVRIQKAEKLLRSFGFNNLRVRHYGKLCRIEVDRDQIKKIFQGKAQDKIIASFKNLGYTYVTLDLEGYRTGSMNEEMN